MIPVISNVSTIEELMDVIEQPMFLLAVRGENSFEFRRINISHQRITGLQDDLLAGQKPHDVLPPRLADTVVSNYELCRSSRAPYTYEEILELPRGARWWQTTLSPILDARGDVAMIVGLAFDITERKALNFDHSQKIAEMTRLNEDLQVFAASTSQDMRGPFETMVALLQMVQDGFVDLGDEKSDQLALCQEIAQDVISKMTNVLEIAQNLNVQESVSEQIDLHHVASDNAAILDPRSRLKMALPTAMIETDRVALQMVLRNLMDNAVRHADSNVCVTLAEQEQGMLAIVVADDGVGQSNELRCDGEAVLPGGGAGHGEFGLASAMAIVTARGGKLCVLIRHFRPVRRYNSLCQVAF